LLSDDTIPLKVFVADNALRRSINLISYVAVLTLLEVRANGVYSAE
jgi:hypothetical protein